MGCAGLSKYEQSAQNTQGKVIGISLCLLSFVTDGPKDPSAGAQLCECLESFLPKVVLISMQIMSINANVNHSRKEASPHFFFPINLFLYLCLCHYVSISYHSFILFDFWCFKFGKTSLCANCKTSMTWTNKFSMCWAHFLT